MGLDMYLFKAKKPDIPFEIYKEDDFLVKDLLLIPNDEHTEEMYKALVPFMTRIQISASEYDAEKIKKDFGLEGSIHISHMSPKGIAFSDRNRTTEEIPTEIIKNHYTISSLKTMYAVDIHQVYYWRKAYGVQEIIHNRHSECIENCGYYVIDDEIADAIAAFDDEFDADIVKRESEPCILYHEWY